jgi:hypothetical protein
VPRKASVESNGICLKIPFSTKRCILLSGAMVLISTLGPVAAAGVRQKRKLFESSNLLYVYASDRCMRRVV